MYKVHGSIIDDCCVYIQTDFNNKYLIRFDETAPGTNIWIINFLLINGSPNNKEVFKTLSIAWSHIKKFLLHKKVNSAFGYIDGPTREVRDKKTKVFTKWIDYPFEYEIDSTPEIRIQGSNGSYQVDTNFFHVKRATERSIKTDKIDPIISQNTQKIKFCFNCGDENKGYKFCPGCGTNLQQE